MLKTRRHFLQAGLALPFVLTTKASRASEGRLELWPDRPPGGGGPQGPERLSRHGALTGISRPHMRIYQPAHPKGAAVLIAGGGGYKRIEMGKEEHPAARWLAACGVTAFELIYRLPPEGWHDGALAPLQDAQRALRLIAANAGAFTIDPGRIGVLGFSAGGHLLGMAAARSSFRSYPPVDSLDALPARPATAALIYPVVSLMPPYQETQTGRSLLGLHPTMNEMRAWSVQTYVTASCPPMFLVQAQDDPIADPQNTVILDDACRRAGVPVELHQLARGGHGFGMGDPGEDTGLWPGWYANWLAAQHML